MKKQSFASKVYWRLYRLKEDVEGEVRVFFQRLFSPLHAAPRDAWECASVIVERVYPLLLNYKRAKRAGYHIVPPFFAIDDWGAVENEEGAIKAWEATLDKMIFACEWTLAESGNKRLEAKMKRRHGDWQAKVPKNRKFFSVGGPTLPSSVLPDGRGYELIMETERLTNEDKDVLVKELGADWEEQLSYYYDSDLHRSLDIKAQEGFELFGKYLMALWD